MENEDIIQSPDDLFSNQITEKVDSNQPTEIVENNIVTPEIVTSEPTDIVEEKPIKYSGFNLNKAKQLLEKPTVEEKPILDFEGIKNFIKSNLNPPDVEEEKKKFSAFNLNKTKEIIETGVNPMSLSAGLLDKIDKFDTHNPNLGIFNRDLSYFYAKELAKKEAEDKAAANPNIVKVDDKTYIDTTTGKKIYEGKIYPDKAFYHLSELGFGFATILSAITDITFDTETLKAVDEFHEKHKFDKPDDFISELTSLLIGYGIPTTGLAKGAYPLRRYLIGRAAALESATARTVATKAIDYIGTGAAFGVIDFLNSDPGSQTTIYEKITGKKNLESEEGLSGRELAATRLRNKLRFGIEGVPLGILGHAVGQGLPVALRYGLEKTGMAAAATYNVGSKVANAVVYQPLASLLSKSDTVVPAISNAIKNGSQFTKETLLSPFIRGANIQWVNGMPMYFPKYTGEIPPYKEWRLFDVADSSPIKSRLKKLDNFISYFREGFKSPSAVFDITETAYANLKAQSKTITKYLDDLEVKSYNLAKSFGEQYKTGTSSEGSREYYLNIVEEFLKNQRKLNSLPKELQETAAALKDHFNNIKKTFLDFLPEGELKDQFSGIVKNYLRKSFAVFTNPEYNPPKDVMETAIKEGVEIIKKYRDMKIAAKEMFPNLPITTAIRNYSETMMKNILRTAKANTVDPIATLRNIAKENLILNKSILSGDELPVTIRKLLGEEKNLRSSVLQTTSSLLTQTVNKKLYDDIAKIGLKEGWLKLSKGLDMNMQKIKNISSLGLMDSKINKLYANSDLALALQGNGPLDNMMKADWYRTLMQIKSGIQFGKTALSPESQLKNVITNAGFPIGYGWLGGKTSLTDAIKIITGDLYGAGKEFNTPAFIKNIEKLTKLRVLDDNIVATELTSVIKKLQEGTIRNSDQLFKKLSNLKIVQEATKAYQGGDNIWRLLGYEWNNSYLTKAFKGDLGKLIKQEELITGKKYNPISSVTGKEKTFKDAVDEFSAWYVRKLMPTYSELPEAIRALRQTLVGNFVSFPAAIIKNTGEAMRIALTEASSDMPEMRQLGLRKIIGLFTTFGGASYAINGLSQKLTGVTDEQMEAYKRSFAPDYVKNASISPYAPIKDDILKLINFSTGDVFDTVKKPLRAAIAEFGKMKNPAEIEEFVFTSMLQAASELTKNFMSENLALKPIMEALPKGVFYGKGGYKEDGTRVYSETDDWGVKLGKSIVHILKAPVPGVVNTTVKFGDSVYDLVTGRSRPDDLRNKFLSAFSGTKVDNIDLQKALESKTIEFAPKLKSELFATEGFYSAKNWQKRKPSVMVKEFESIQEEGFQQQKEFRQIIKDARTLNIPEQVIQKILMDKLKDKELVGNLLYTNKFTPVNFNEKALFDRYEKIRREELLSNRENPNMRDTFPVADLARVRSKHYGLSLDDNYEDAILRKEKESEEARKMKALAGIQEADKKFLSSDVFSEEKTPEFLESNFHTIKIQQNEVEPGEEDKILYKIK